MYGDEDMIDNQIAAVGEFFRQMIPGSHLVAFPGKGHSPQVSSITRFHKELEVFITANDCNIVGSGMAATTRYVTSSGQQIAYQTKGCGTSNSNGRQVIIFLSGVGFTSEGWNNQLNYFGTDYCVIVPDFRGMGRSAQSGPTTYNNDTDVADVVAILNSLSITSAVVVGHDRGGHIAQGLAIHYPSMVSKLVLVDASPSFVNYPGWDLALNASSILGLEGYLLADRAGWTNVFLTSAFDTTGCTLDSTTRTFYQDNLDNITTERLSADITSLTTIILTDQLSKITMPTLVLYGDGDAICPGIAAIGDYFRVNLADAYLVGFHPVGHMPMATGASRFNSEVLSFVDGSAKMCDYPGSSSGGVKLQLQLWVLAALLMAVSMANF